MSVAGIDDAFWVTFVRDARAMPGSPDPRDLAAVMLAESTMFPTAVNPAPDAPGHSDVRGIPDNRPMMVAAAKADPDRWGQAVGLNQLFRSNWPQWLARQGLSAADYLAMSASQQWQAVVRNFFTDQLSRFPQAAEEGARDIYWLNFVPALYRPNQPDDYVITTNKSILAQNPGFAEPDGTIRPRGLARFLASAQAHNAGRWSAILAAIGEAEGSVGPPPPGAPLPPPRSASLKRVGAGAAVVLFGAALVGGTLLMKR